MRSILSDFIKIAFQDLGKILMCKIYFQDLDCVNETVRIIIQVSFSALVNSQLSPSPSLFFCLNQCTFGCTFL